MVIVWDVAAGQPLLTFTDHVGYVYGLAFTPDGRQLSSASGGDAIVYGADSWE